MIDIVIVNWNSGRLLKKCIDSILLSKNECYVNRIIIIDNHSTDESMTGILHHEKVFLIQNKENLGFAKACNQGFKSCTAKHVLLLNPDTRLFDNTLEACSVFMTANSDIDILGCQLLNDSGKVTTSCTRFPTVLRLLTDAIGLSKIAPKIFTPAILMTDWDHGQSRYVDQVMGAFMFMHTNIFKKLGYFDERFFVYYEELDFSLRLAKAGGKTYYNAQIKAIHTGMGTTEAIKAFRLFLNLRSRLMYAKKHFSIPGFWLVYISTFTLEFISRLFFLLLSGRFGEMKDVVRGYMLLAGNKTPVPGLSAV